jgi:hypothetical protein
MVISLKAVYVVLQLLVVPNKHTYNCSERCKSLVINFRSLSDSSADIKQSLNAEELQRTMYLNIKMSYVIDL